MFIPNEQIDWVDDKPTECEWFAGCHNDVAGLQQHPVLAWVPICEKHHDWLQDS